MNNYEYINYPNYIYDNNIRDSYINNNILNPYEGYIKGNIFNNLYDSYKNYKPYNINSKNEKENMLMQIQQYNFILRDLGLYLDIYPKDMEALGLYNNYLNIYMQIYNKYESMYGPLTKDFISNNWLWDNSPWPWEVI